MEIQIAIGLIVAAFLTYIQYLSFKSKRREEEERRKADENRRKADENRRKKEEDLEVRYYALKDAYDNLKLEHGIEKADDLHLMQLAALVGALTRQTRKSLKLNGEYVGTVADLPNYGECACSWCNKTLIKGQRLFRVLYNGDFVSVTNGSLCIWCSFACAKSEMESR